MAEKFEAPHGCRWCGDEQFHHGSQWSPIIGLHTWLEPSQAMVLERMTRRRADYLAAKPTVYHAGTAWAASDDGEEGIPYCADCKTDRCRLWTRIQSRLDRIRWGLNEPKHAVGGNEPW